MKIEQLEAFEKVCKVGSINKAAQQCHMTEQNLNKIIKTMENELGETLLYRSNKGISMTEAGNLVFDFAQNVVGKYIELKDKMKGKVDYRQAIVGKLDIDLSPTLNIAVLPYAIKEFFEKYPKIITYTNEKYRDNIINDVSQNKNMVGILCVSSLIENFIASIPENVEICEIKKYPIYVAMSMKHPLANNKYVTLKNIQTYPLIVYEAGGADGVYAFNNKLTTSSNNIKVCENKLLDDKSVMYSFPIYKKRGILADCIHIPFNGHNAYSIVYTIINKDIDKEQYKLVQLFLKVFNEYL